MIRSRNLLILGFSAICTASVMAQNEPMDLKEGTTETTVTTETVVADTDHKGVDDFFNIREANTDVKCGQWEFEFDTAWSTYYSGQRRDDDLTMSPSILYGITDELFAEIQLLPVNIGDGLHLPSVNNSFRDAADDGTGDVALKLFWQFLKEQDAIPAMALWGTMRLPTGIGSEKIDGRLNMTMTKTICEGFRGHFQGFVETANGARGDADRPEYGDRRHFQWGVGPGVDYAINECNLLVLNYLNRSNNMYGHQNNNVVELGWVYEIDECSYLKAAVDAETHADAGGAHWTAKLQYSIKW